MTRLWLWQINKWLPGLGMGSVREFHGIIKGKGVVLVVMELHRDCDGGHMNLHI